MCWGAVVPVLLLVFPAFHCRGPQNMDLFNLTTPSISLTAAERMPRVKEEPMAGGNGNPRLQAPHPDSKPSPLLLAPREGCQAAVPSTEGFQSQAWEGDPGTVGARTGSHHHHCPWSGSFPRRWKCPASCGQGGGPAWALRQRAVALWAQSHPGTQSRALQPPWFFTSLVSPQFSHLCCYGYREPERF